MDPRPGDYIPAPELGPHAIELVTPTHCPNGHPSPRIGWTTCTLGGHYTWRCQTCDAVIEGTQKHGAQECRATPQGR